METWKAIPGHKGYEVSDLGQVRSIDRWLTYKNGVRRLQAGRVLRQFMFWNGYKTTHLGSKSMNNYVHHLVAIAFLGKRPKGMVICHINGNKSDNLLTNLRYATQVANMQDAVRHRYEQAWKEHAENSR